MYDDNTSERTFTEEMKDLVTIAARKGAEEIEKLRMENKFQVTDARLLVLERVYEEEVWKLAEEAWPENSKDYLKWRHEFYADMSALQTCFIFLMEKDAAYKELIFSIFRKFKPPKLGGEQD